ncbi:hypothetical protein L484_012594 [Morus notabilis]|uniref:BZIP domain-containing protein n=1 Tax=Morus notabilis TaxID=981085 RepID=W9QKZ9_9ROSA|nr:basic leucine zipper 6 [Morus notabilis]XP_024017480.1 basic leucine zipper 6 [Morus notabilis]EXB39586.1 hypothetical protein L484_012594 [Morus notabilis]
MTTRQAQAQAHLPPRCPIQKKPINGPIPDPITFPSQDHEFSSSQPSMEDHPTWLYDLLSDPESNLKGGLRPLRRSVSDSVTLLDSVAGSLSFLGPNYDEGNSVGGQTCGGFESDSMYGPNSPRLRSSSSLSESAIVSALSECVSQEPPGQYVDGGLCVSGAGCSEGRNDGELSAEAKAAKRHPGQRSRIRKLQYIAELERTVDVLQTFESDLAVRVTSLLQQRVALSVENSELKQQLARLRKEKLVMDGQYQLLKKEVKRLRAGLTNSTNTKIRTCFARNPQTEAGSLEAMQMTLDMDKLNLY